MTTSAVCRSIKKLKAKQRAKLGIPKRMQIRYKRMHSGWQAIKGVVEHGVLVEATLYQQVVGQQDPDLVAPQRPPAGRVTGTAPGRVGHSDAQPVTVGVVGHQQVGPGAGGPGDAQIECARLLGVREGHRGERRIGLPGPPPGGTPPPPRRAGRCGPP